MKTVGKGDEGVDIARALERAAAAALVIPAPELATLVITGGDRQTWLNGLITCDLAPLKAGDVAYGLFVAQKGRIEADAIVALEESRMLLALPRAVASEVRASLERHVIMEDVEIADGAFEVEAVHGPRAAEVLAAARVAGAHGGVLDRTGLGGALLFLPAQSLAPAREARDAALASVGGMLGDDQAWEALRLDRRVPQFGADFDATTYPQEAGLEKRAISFSKGCYLGQEVVFMLEKRGQVRRKLVTLRVESDLPPPRGADVLDESGENVGTVTSAAIVPSAGGPVAMAMVKRATAEKGEKEERAELSVVGSKARLIGVAG
ncbi:MAG: YgfZ/GcvT domain-containing protein [Polyangiaceae bacterium]